ncbi:MULTISPECIES: pilus assembly protein PilM [unclassified Butyrivibrio]|uniref:pilus assembly protein PilM n=1 Tax=unclassified Butyrivibrio TaxID=2639466 RepID=UPI0003B387F4|nr:MULTISPECIES: pilus assembly protein PilM [unclassified Butyrivibrio]SEK92629.1 type IV pilus assembly protein PilM [Butyrivibrio sp. ob235]
MPKNDGVLGISVTHGRLALTLMKGGIVRKSEWEEIPDNIVEGTKIISQNLFADFLREQIKEKGIKCKTAAYVIPDSDIFVKNITMPKIADDQLRFNVPFEFKDLIQGELNQYVFDYVKRESASNDENTINLLAYAVPVNSLANIRETLKQAGLKLVKALPETSVYEALIGALGNEEEIKKERCFMDIGRRAIRMMIFKNGEFKLSHFIDVGEDQVIRAIADELNVDTHLAITYLRSRYQDCDKLPSAVNAYKDISIEILKGLNFYEMSDMTSRLKDIVLCGTGAMTEPLVEMLKERLDKTVVTMDELYPNYNKEKEINVTYGSVGVLLSDALGVATNSNLASAGQKKKTNLKAVFGTIAAILVAALLIGKFGFVDRLNTLANERERANELQQQINEQSKFIKESEQLTQEYYHYSWDQMSDEEKSRVSRVDTLKLIDLIGSQGMKVKFMDLSSETLTIDLLANDLDSVSKLTTVMEEEDIVESCSVVSAKTLTEETDGVKTDAGVTAQIKVHLTKGSSEEEN